jgi:hypothetical protein
VRIFAVNSAESKKLSVAVTIGEIHFSHLPFIIYNGDKKSIAIKNLAENIEFLRKFGMIEIIKQKER